MHLGQPANNALDELRYVGTPSNIFRRPTDRSNLSVRGHVFGKAAAVGMSGTGSEKTIVPKLILKLGRKIKILGSKIFL